MGVWAVVSTRMAYPKYLAVAGDVCYERHELEPVVEHNDLDEVIINRYFLPANVQPSMEIQAYLIVRKKKVVPAGRPTIVLKLEPTINSCYLWPFVGDPIVYQVTEVTLEADRSFLKEFEWKSFRRCERRLIHSRKWLLIPVE
ncbi:MAG: hypothetical protein WCG48_00790 [Candidatus Berkelbacteria bacterium]